MVSAGAQRRGRVQHQPCEHFFGVRIRAEVHQQLRDVREQFLVEIVEVAPVRERGQRRIGLQRFVTGQRLSVTDWRVAGLLGRSLPEHGPRRFEVRAIEMGESHVVEEVCRALTECGGSREGVDGGIESLQAATGVAEVDPVRTLVGLLQREAIEDLFRLAEAAATQQRGAEESKRARVLGLKPKRVAAQCLGGFELVAAERLRGALNEGFDVRFGGRHVRHSKEKGRVVRTTRPLIFSRSADQNFWLTLSQKRRPCVSYVCTSVFALVTLFWYRIGGCLSPRFCTPNCTLVFVFSNL
jgi:hypothetical protein